MAMGLTIPRYTVDDLEQFPNDGNRYELLDGALIVTPAPAVVHEIVVSRIHTRLSVAVQLPGIAHVFGRGAVTRLPDTQLEPDVLVLPPRFAFDAKWHQITERWLAVEVFSRSSRRFDREHKRDAYFALGLREVWLVDPRDRSVEVCRAPGPGEAVRDTIRWHVPTLDLVVPIDLSEIFAGID
jgi:Uma2 family endonuclease